jgi:hypothetical protein
VEDGSEAVVDAWTNSGDLAAEKKHPMRDHRSPSWCVGSRGRKNGLGEDGVRDDGGKNASLGAG